jgi:hypothetical protein
MALLEAAATVILQHLTTRDADLHLRKQYQAMWRRRWSEVARARQQLAGLNPATRSDHSRWPIAIKEQTESQGCRTLHGSLVWWESWHYPSQVLLQRQAGFGLYGLRLPDLPPWPLLKVDGMLVLLAIAEDEARPLAVSIPLTGPWSEPRLVLQRLKRLAPPQWGPLPKRMEQDFFRDFQTDLPDNGPRLWRLLVTPKMRIADVLSLLVVVARKQGFPVSADDEARWGKWMRQVMRNALRRSQVDEHACTQIVEELAGTVYQGVLERFDQPGTPWALRAFIRATTAGLAKEMVKADWRGRGSMPEPEPLIDPNSGAFQGMAYPLPCVAQELGVSEKTVRRWMDRYGYIKAPSGARALTEDQLNAFKLNLVPKAIRRLLQAHGYSPEAAEKKVQRWKKNGLTVEEMLLKAEQAYPRKHRQE